MMLKKITVAVALSVASTAALAGSFDGPFVQLGIGTASSTLQVPADVYGTGTGTFKLGDTSFIGQIAAGYSYGWDEFNLAGSAYYVIGDQKSGSLPNSAEFKGKDTWGVSVDPGIYLNDSTLVYLKLGYVQTKGVAELAGGGSLDQSFDGFGYGLGLKLRFSSNIYWLAELQEAQFASKTWTGYSGKAEFRPRELTAIVGVGYKF